MARAIIPNIHRLAAAMRKAGGIAALTQAILAEDWTWHIYNHFATAEWREHVMADSAPGSSGHQIAAEMEVAPPGPARA